MQANGAMELTDRVAKQGTAISITGFAICKVRALALLWQALRLQNPSSAGARSPLLIRSVALSPSDNCSMPSSQPRMT